MSKVALEKPEFGSPYRPDIRGMDSSHLRAVYQNILVMIWRNEITEAAVVGLARDLHRLSSIYSDGIGYFFICEKTFGMIDVSSSQMLHLQKVIAAYSHAYLAAVMVLEVEGIAGLMARIAFNVISVVALGLYPKLVSSSVDEAVDRMVPHMGAHVCAADLKVAMKFIRSQFVIGAVDSSQEYAQIKS